MAVYSLTAKICFLLNHEVFLTVHLMLELSGIIISILVSIFCCYEFQYKHQRKMLILALAFCALAMLDFVHTLSYLGMPNFITENSTNKASIYRMLARLVQSVGIFLAVFLPNKKLHISIVPFLCLTVLLTAAGIAAAAAYMPYLPIMYDPQLKSQTTAKIFAEYLVIFLYILTVIKLLISKLDDRRDLWLVYALSFGIFGEIAFAAGDAVYDSYNLLGHMFKIISFSLLLKGFFDEAIGELYRTNDELNAQRLALEKANKQLKKADQLKDDFLAVTSHELRSPLTAIIAFAELLLDPQTGSLNPLQRDYLNEITDSSNDLLNRVNEIRDLSRIKAGKMVLRFEKVQLKKLIESAARRFEPQFKIKGIALKVCISKDLAVRGDSGRIGQILNNLITNALKFTPSGGEVKIIVDENTISNQAEITVADNGIGISPSEQQAVFEMFYQVDATSSRSYGGTGIGLSLVKNLVEMHGGTIKLVSECNKGSAFTFTLPLYHR